MSKKKDRYVNTDRVPGGFIALPWDVLDSSAYQKLSYPAKCLLIELARQLGPDNNGRLLLTLTKLKKRGWNSADVISRAKKELLNALLIHETVMGYRPNKASWYAVTWMKLYPNPKYDPGTYETFKRGSYQMAQESALTIPASKTDWRSNVPSYGLSN